jgi:hypothetical protein
MIAESDVQGVADRSGEPNTEFMLSDLARSGLKPTDLHTRSMQNPEYGATGAIAGTPGYVIPYFDINSKPVPFYRVKLNVVEGKYRQPREKPNHVYFPPNFAQVFAAAKFKYLFITEGEKKAGIACKMGFPCAALGGVDSWKNRNLLLPKDTEISAAGALVNARLPADAVLAEDWASPLALGMQSIIDAALHHNTVLILCFDSDFQVGIKPAVQRAAAAFGFELRYRGIPFANIRQLILPNLQPNGQHYEKTGLDDFLLHAPAGKFAEVLDATLMARSAFPRHPSIRDYINKRLQKAKLSRKEAQAVGMAILSELDSNGMRLRSKAEGRTYYFDQRQHKLMRANFMTGQKEESHDSPFGQFLYQKLGISLAADARIMGWLGAQFTAEDPIADISPHRVIARKSPSDDSVHLQLGDGDYASVTSQGLTLRQNGDDGILFEAEQVVSADPAKVKSFFEGLKGKYDGKVVPNQWDKVLDNVRLRDHDRGQKVLALLYYIAPWLNRWRGTQLPIELILGEAGSGKSSLASLRLGILSGNPELKNAPQDLKDWHASIANTGALHVTDNVQMVDKNLRQRLSDELCRLVTEPAPSIEMRKYYTEADLIKFPIRTSFAITAIKQPFQNVDLLQRSIITEFDKNAALQRADGEKSYITYDSDWTQRQIDAHGGREAWIAHHLYVLYRFFQVVERHWNPKYDAKHRLVNLEQSLMLMAKVFGWEADWIPAHLGDSSTKSMAESDWIFEGLQAYCDNVWSQESPIPQLKRRFTVKNVSDFCEDHEAFKDCEALTNTRKLAHYIKNNAAQLATSLGLEEAGKANNATQYKLTGPPKALD